MGKVRGVKARQEGRPVKSLSLSWPSLHGELFRTCLGLSVQDLDSETFICQFSSHWSKTSQCSINQPYLRMWGCGNVKDNLIFGCWRPGGKGEASRPGVATVWPAVAVGVRWAETAWDSVWAQILGRLKLEQTSESPEILTAIDGWISSPTPTVSGALGLAGTGTGWC